MDTVFESQHPLIKHKLTQLRDRKTPPTAFRRLTRELSVLLAYEATRHLPMREATVTTPLDMEARGVAVNERIGLVPILRAGLGMVEGFLSLLPKAEVWHIGLYRDEETLRPVSYYNKLPATPRVEVCYIVDPMLATGGSATAAATVIKEWGVPEVKFVGILAAPEGIALMQREHPDVDIYVAQIDSHLTPEPETPDDFPKGFIVPGLGDAGDRLYGTQPNPSEETNE